MKNYLIYLVLLYFLFGCEKDPGFSNIPAITFKSISFQKSNQEVIKVELNFTDGDGDLGFNENDNTGKFDPKFVKIIRFDTISLDPFKTKIKDSINAITNENYYNYLVSFIFSAPGSNFLECKNINNCLVTASQNSNVFGSGLKPYELDSIFRKGYYGRYTNLNSDGNKRPISGVLTYNISSASFTSTLKNKTIKLKIKIRDKALNESNEIITDALSF
ncbi:MAG: hypothetical protein EAZ27_11610 [Cytophagales bacterium]|nr:MAG: hypothetical protein EAZ27_11610 [Cytophagales bacterium]